MGRLSKIAARVTAAERAYYQEGDLGPGAPDRTISSLPKIKVPQVWEFSAHPHLAERAGPHIDLRLGNPETGVAHSFVLPKRTELPGPGQSALVVPTFDHTIPYMDYTGPISTEYGKGKVEKGRRTQADVYHATPDDKPGTKLRFNLYDGLSPEEYAIIRLDRGWRIVNKTLTRERRPDLPADKPKYKELDVSKVDSTTPGQVMMPKLDGAHGIIDLQAGRAPRVFSYRTAKKAPTGLIEHTHKLPDLLKDKVPKSLDDTILRGEILAVDQKGKALPAETIGGLLNTKVWNSRAKQEELGARLHAFSFDVVKYKGKPMADAPFSEKLKVLKQVEKEIGDLWLPEIATTPKEKSKLLQRIEQGKHPLTREGVVLVKPEVPGSTTKAKFAPDFDVVVRDVHPAVSGKTGEPHDRAGSISYSWTGKGPIVGQLGGFSHDLGKDMLKNPDKYIGRAAKVKATKVFAGERGEPGALFQPRFKEWHLEKGDIEKAAGVVDVTTHDSSGTEHIKPFSFVNRVEGSKPPALGITMLKPGGRTLANVKATGELKVDGKPLKVTKIQDAEVVFASEGDTEKAAFLDELRKIAALQPEEVGEVEITQDPDEFTSKLQPGDVIVTRGNRRLSRIISLVQRVKGLPKERAMWTHSGLYLGDGKMRHAHLPIIGRGMGMGGSKVRDHRIEAVHNLGVDFLALRPEVPEEERGEAITRSNDLLGKKFSTWALTRAGFLPKMEWKSKELKEKNLPENVICTSVVGYSYPKVQFGPPMRSIHNLMPAEVAGSPKLAPVAALSAKSKSKMG